MPETRPPSRRAPWRRSYAAASPDGLAGGFGTLFHQSRRDTVRRELRGLIGHARHAAENFDYARAYEMLFRRHVIGQSGIRLQMDARTASGRPATRGNAEIERAWRAWGAVGQPTICGGLSWWALECVIATALAREGGALLRLHRGRSRGPFGFRVEPVPLDLLDLDHSRPTAEGGGWIEAGIEYDRDGRVRAFHIWNVHPSEGHRSLARRRLRIPAADMLHIMIPEEIGQALGVPRSATALRLMNMGESFTKSAMAAADWGARQVVYYEQESESGYIADADGVDEPEPIIEPGTTTLLPPGVTAKPTTPHYPEAAVEPFMRFMGTSMSAGVGVAYETLTGDLSRANFSSLRAGKGEERDEWRMLQRAVSESLHARVFAEWLPVAMLAGGVRLPLRDLDRYLGAAIWRPRGWPSVNPRDDATAAEKEISLGLKSRTEIAAERGRDFADICAERQAEEALMREHGLEVGSLLARPTVETGEAKDKDGGNGSDG